MKVIFGLGNPGQEYANTRHNIGFTVIDYLADKWDISLKQTKFKGIYNSGIVNGEKVVLIKPLTFMNLSGECIAAFVDFYKLEIEDYLVVYDDLDMPTGKLRLRTKGSAGGHNGIRSIIGQLGSDEFNRIRIGIGRPTEGMRVYDHVLTYFRPDEMYTMRKAVIQAAEACEYWLDQHFLNVMNRFNTQ